VVESSRSSVLDTNARSGTNGSKVGTLSPGLTFYCNCLASSQTCFLLQCLFFFWRVTQARCWVDVEKNVFEKLKPHQIPTYPDNETDARFAKLEVGRLIGSPFWGQDVFHDTRGKYQTHPKEWGKNDAGFDHLLNLCTVGHQQAPNLIFGARSLDSSGFYFFFVS